MKAISQFEHWEHVANGALPEFVVEWESITRRTLQEFSRLLDEGRGERPLQASDSVTPTILIQVLRGGYFRWAIPQKRLGDKHVTDFILGEFTLSGTTWYPVEREPYREAFHEVRRSIEGLRIMIARFKIGAFGSIRIWVTPAETERTVDLNSERLDQIRKQSSLSGVAICSTRHSSPARADVS